MLPEVALQAAVGAQARRCAGHGGTELRRGLTPSRSPTLAAYALSPRRLRTLRNMTPPKYSPRTIGILWFTPEGSGIRKPAPRKDESVAFGSPWWAGGSSCATWSVLSPDRVWR